ncbi:DUF1365 domain-containing protein [Amycolatopsis albispora]|uniref:DUF1365 domain-containing protein n=1 Tax=Amycolatopsis albispora TaxID=1804986 RepID=A0A344L7A8_9PSEU|nr:DUF1365 domain-containing protein [Amycolatopsis albispora]AXB43932.1 hypothetical protein A4R43_16525 [Amycolatopsis albispora]
MVTAALYDATVAHVRRIEPPLSFAHRLHLWLVDVDDLPRLPRWLRPFARFDARDHFGPGPGTIRQKLDAWLAARGIDLAGGRVVMLASARVLGYVFNPITLYWCHRPDGEPACVVAEVHNTYRGRHAYLLFPDAEGRATAAKEFFVSPFQTGDGEYRMSVPEPDSLLAVSVVLHQAGSTPLAATLRGVRRAAGPGQVARMLLARPFVPQRVTALIRKHGAVLWLRRAPMAAVAPADRLGELGGCGGLDG